MVLLLSSCYCHGLQWQNCKSIEPMMQLHHECVKTSCNMEYASALLMTPIPDKSKSHLLGPKYIFKEKLGPVFWCT